MDSKKVTAVFFILCIGLASATKEDDSAWGWQDYAVMGAGAAAAVVGAPLAVSAAGFGAGGIAAGTLAAKGMSLAATYGVGGGAIAALQSVGAAGMGWLGTTMVGAAGAAGGKVVKNMVSGNTEGKEAGTSNADNKDDKKMTEEMEN